MPESFTELMLRAQADTMARELARCNERTQAYGLTLNEHQVGELVRARGDALLDTGRIEPGACVLPRIIDTFCDSPYLLREAYAQTLGFLQDLFYTLKNETEAILTDDELIEALARIYNGRAQGSLEYLENLTVGDLYRSLTHGADDCNSDDDEQTADWAEEWPDE